MREMVLASRNAHKIREFHEIFSEAGLKVRLLSLDEAGVTGEIEETGRTFAENAVLKALAPALRGFWGLADDSGLCVDALNGAPGVFSARFAGAHGDDEANNRLLLEKLAHVPEDRRGAAYECALALVWPKTAAFAVPAGLDASGLIPGEYRDSVGGALVVRGECRGRILFAYEGKGGFGYDPLFYCPEAGASLATVPPEAKNALSHRGRAVRRLAEVLGSLSMEHVMTK